MPVLHREVFAVRVLGPLEVAVGGQPVAIAPGRLRALLVALALSAETAVSPDRLIDPVWGEQLPDNPRRSLHTYVNRLRGLLGVERISTGPGGYTLHAAPEHVDVVRFRSLMQAAAQTGDPGAERATLAEALSLWRGTPFDGISSSWLERTEAPALTELYLTGVERAADLDLARDRHNELVLWLGELAARHSLRESLWLRLIWALDRGGRHAEALQRYEEIRRHLADELGVEPGPQLQSAYADLLANRSPAPDAGAPVRDPGPPATPRQLPADVDGFTGRVGELAALDRLATREPPASRRALVLIAIAGTAGVGKTALAVHWGHRVAGQFPDGQLYANLRGFDPTAPVERADQVIRGFLAALGMPPGRVPDTLPEQAAMYRTLLADRRALVILDNARDAEQVRPLLPGAGRCVVVVTSRDQLPGLVAAEGAHPVQLDLLTDQEAHALLRQRLGAARVAAEPRPVAEIVARCAGLPLALAIVAARAATHPRFSLDKLAAELSARDDDLDAFANGDTSTDLRAVFSWSYRALHPAAARLFRLLGLHPGPDFTAAAAASLLAVAPARSRALLAELARAHLVVEHVPERYRMHDLLHAYAAELTNRAGERRRKAVQRMLDHYLRTAHAAALLIYPRDPITLPRQLPGVTPERLADHAQAMAWFGAEHRTLLAAVDLAARAEYDTHAWQLAWTLYSFFDWQGQWHDQIVTQRTALLATQRLGDQAAEARTHVNLAHGSGRLRRYHETHGHLRQALDLYTRLGDKIGQARTHLNLCQVNTWQDNHTRALEHSLVALDLHRAADHRPGEAEALNEVGWCYAMLGEYRQTISYCEQALARFQDLGHRHGAAAAWDSLGYAHHHLGRPERSIACYRRALDLYEALGDRYRTAETLTRLGEAYAANGDAKEARAMWHSALRILDEIGHTDAEQIREMMRSTDATISDESVAQTFGGGTRSATARETRPVG